MEYTEHEKHYFVDTNSAMILHRLILRQRGGVGINVGEEGMYIVK